MSPEKVEQYYLQKSKWLRLRREHTDDISKIPETPDRYVRRKQFTLECLRDLQRDAALHSLLDVGTAAGFFLRELGTSFAEKLGCDLDHAAIQYATNVLHQPAVALSIT